MSVILDIATAVPEYSVTKQEVVDFYKQAMDACDMPDISKKLNFIMEKTQINGRFSCIPDYNADSRELFTGNNYMQPVEKRMSVYKDKILPLASKAIKQVLRRNNIVPGEVTHLITVSCTGLFAPGLEFLIAEHFGLQHTEKLALNFLGCYAAIKALNHARYIALANPDACILIISAELCSLHFVPSVADEDVIANLLFSDGAAAVIVCGKESKLIRDKVVLAIDNTGSACIPHTAGLMTWDISASAFRMYLSKYLVTTIKDAIKPVVNHFLADNDEPADYWAIHPGGVRILEAVKESLGLSELNIEDSREVLKQYGNMSSPTILFILSRILEKVRMDDFSQNKKIFACGFGPGLTVEMIQFISAKVKPLHSHKQNTSDYAIQEQIG